MTALIERLREYKLRLLSPDTGVEHRSTIGSIRAFRNCVYDSFGFLSPSTATAPEDADDYAWHLLAYRADQIVGCIRFVPFSSSLSETLSENVLANSRCSFAPPDQERFSAALSSYAHTRPVSGGPFVQIGGLAVAKHVHRSAVGPALCLAGNAFMRLVRSTSSIVFAAEKTGGAKIYEKAGCFPLFDEASPLGGLWDAYHKDRVLVMGCAPSTNAPEFEPALVTLGELLSTQPAFRKFVCV